MGYAKKKEALIVPNTSLYCDTVLPNGIVVERRCSIKEFKEWAAEQIKSLTVAASAAAAEGDTGISTLQTLRTHLLPTLRKVRELRSITDCRFLWKRVQDLDLAVCGGLAPLTALGAMQVAVLGGVAVIGIVVQYKVWRHLKDNKVVGLELERFRNNFYRIQREMRKKKAI